MAIIPAMQLGPSLTPPPWVVSPQMGMDCTTLRAMYGSGAGTGMEFMHPVTQLIPRVVLRVRSGSSAADRGVTVRTTAAFLTATGLCRPTGITIWVSAWPEDFSFQQLAMKNAPLIRTGAEPSDLGVWEEETTDQKRMRGRRATPTFVAGLADQWVGVCDWVAALENELVKLCPSDHSPEQHSLLRPEPNGFPLHPRKSPRRGAILIVVSAQFQLSPRRPPATGDRMRPSGTV